MMIFSGVFWLMEGFRKVIRLFKPVRKKKENGSGWNQPATGLSSIQKPFVETKENPKKKFHCGECGTPVISLERGACETCESTNLVEREVCVACERLLNSTGQCDICSLSPPLRRQDGSTSSATLSKCPFCETRFLMGLTRESKKNDLSEPSRVIGVLNIMNGLALLSFLEISKGEWKLCAAFKNKEIKGIEVNKFIFKARSEGCQFGEVIIMAPDNRAIKNSLDFLGWVFSRQVGKKDLCSDCFGFFMDPLQYENFKTNFKGYLGKRPARGIFSPAPLSGPEEKLELISKAVDMDPKKARVELGALIDEYPDCHPAQIFYAEWQYGLENFKMACKHYELAFKIGPGKALDYSRASISASKIGNTEKALKILQKAESELPSKSMTGVMFFNMGCHQAMLGFYNQAIDYLKRAIKAGYTKGDAYRDDPDLAPLRSIGSFQKLLKSDFTYNLECPKCDKPLKAKESLRGGMVDCPKCKTRFKA